MEKFLPVVNLFAGLMTFSLGILALDVYSNWAPDYVAIGIWGGIYLVAFAFLLITKKLKSSRIVRRMAELSAVTGITMIGLYSWSIDCYQPLIANCEMYSSINSTLSNNLTIGETYPDIFSPLKICERAAIDSLMIICGILAVIASGLVDVMASSFESD